ncbi:unnamed protein product [Peronospora belbahrii]|uniref:Uncharacterized protein n=1 Tax=Peronospora belbahrii TaxID=622444 RepID=A0AAU9L305_9STRA|nr:unnamed protein product [Peronospora belbahrii]
MVGGAFMINNTQYKIQRCTPNASSKGGGASRGKASCGENGLLDACEMVESAQDRVAAAAEAAERTRGEQQVLVERLCQLETATFEGPQQNESARARAGLGPSRRQRRRQGMSHFGRHRRVGKV